MEHNMRNAITRITVVILVSILSFHAAALADTTNYISTIAHTNCKANLREKASTKSNRLAVLSTGTEVVIIETLESNGDTWCYITAENPSVNGYVLLSLLDIEEEHVSTSCEGESRFLDVLNDKALCSDFLYACEQIGMDASKIQNLKQVDDWVSGPRFSFTYMNMDFRLYCNMDSTVNTIKLGVDTDVFRQGYVPYQVSDYIVDTSVAVELRTVTEDYVKNQLNYPATADFKWIDWSYGREGDMYSVSSEVTAENAFGVKEELLFSLVFHINGGTAKLLYFMLDGVEIVNNLASDTTPERQKATSSISKTTSDSNGITLVYGQLGEYGKTITLDGEDYIDYHVPKGSYTITNNGKWCKVYLAKDKYYKNSDGYMENEIVKTLEFSSYSETQMLVISSGQHIELTINASITLTPN